jgi:hypothetical protein
MGQGSTVVTSVIPAGGASAVDPGGPIEVVFSDPLAAGMETYVALHQGDIAAPVVSGVWTWSEDRTHLTFVPAAPLAPRTTHTIHLGGRLRDADGGVISYEHCTSRHGGQWATGQMMGAGNLLGRSGCHASGAYGIVFAFTTH